MEYKIEQEGDDVVFLCPHCGNAMLLLSPRQPIPDELFSCRQCGKQIDLGGFLWKSEQVFCRACGKIQSESRSDSTGANATQCEYCLARISLKSPSLPGR